MLERLELEAFLTLAEELHFGRTAERLHVTTGRISQTIKKLERHIGAPLFDRTNRSVGLTPIGHRLQEDLRPAYEQIQAGLTRAIDSARPAPSGLRIGYVGAIAGQVVYQAHHLFRSREPGCRVQMREVQLIEAVARLRNGEVDILVVHLPIAGPDLITGPVIICESRMLAISTDHPLARRTSVTMEDLVDVPLGRVAGVGPGDWPSDRWPDRTPQGRAIPKGPEVETFLEAQQLIGAGTCGAIVGAHVTRFNTRPDITYVPFSDAPQIDWAPVWLKSNNTPANRAFARTALEVAQRVYVAATH
ncbi:LysR family transcriptional regulator [Streptomyces sp. YC504]|uniref:LysR family transcriptional regulator n=1 Tax=Streptomyces mesophilus TaxID=1775132 RepID=A0A6G4XNN0_9ACTN|nr:LysR family transcriptional regulator [Streptomyces mesophilus]NGO79038.1 LysR family transcriptional regulator [Streptomyces mesophilus]